MNFLGGLRCGIRIGAVRVICSGSRSFSAEKESIDLDAKLHGLRSRVHDLELIFIELKEAGLTPNEHLGSHLSRLTSEAENYISDSQKLKATEDRQNVILALRESLKSCEAHLRGGYFSNLFQGFGGKAKVVVDHVPNVKEVKTEVSLLFGGKEEIPKKNNIETGNNSTNIETGNNGDNKNAKSNNGDNKNATGNNGDNKNATGNNGDNKNATGINGVVSAGSSSDARPKDQHLVPGLIAGSLLLPLSVRLIGRRSLKSRQLWSGSTMRMISLLGVPKILLGLLMIFLGAYINNLSGGVSLV